MNKYTLELPETIGDGILATLLIQKHSVLKHSVDEILYSNKILTDVEITMLGFKRTDLAAIERILTSMGVRIPIYMDG